VSHDQHHEASLPAHALPDRLCRVASVGSDEGEASAAMALPHVWPVGDVEEDTMTDIEARYLRATRAATRDPLPADWKCPTCGAVNSGTTCWTCRRAK